MQDFKWKGVPVSQLEDKVLESAYKHTLAILNCIIHQLNKRGYFNR